MIQLDIKEYCQACPHFEPVVVKRPETAVLKSFSDLDEVIEITNGNTIVMCEKRGRCAAIYAYLKGASRK